MRSPIEEPSRNLIKVQSLCPCHFLLITLAKRSVGQPRTPTLLEEQEQKKVPAVYQTELQEMVLEVGREEQSYPANDSLRMKYALKSPLLKPPSHDLKYFHLSNCMDEEIIIFPILTIRGSPAATKYQVGIIPGEKQREFTFCLPTQSSEYSKIPFFILSFRIQPGITKNPVPPAHKRAGGPGGLIQGQGQRVSLSFL